jgi:branched-chain amino acid transport system permease protein
VSSPPLLPEPRQPHAGWTAFHALWPVALAVAVGLIMFYVVGPRAGGYPTNVMMFIGINIILAVSLTVVNGFAGQFSLGHAGFMALGGYLAAAIVYYGSMKIWNSADFTGGALSFTGTRGIPESLLGRGDLLFVGACLLGGVVAAAAGYVVGQPSLRLRGDYLAIVTLGFGEIVRVLLQGTKDQIQPWNADQIDTVPAWQVPLMLGGPKGFNLLPTYTTLFWVYASVVLTLILIYRLKLSSTGRAFLSIREDEIAAQAMGVDITRYKVRAFVISSFFAGVAGGLYAMTIGAISATDLGFQRSFDIIIMVVLGGLGSISGAVLAAILLTILPELLRAPPPVWPAGLALLAVMAVVQGTRRRWNWKPLAFTTGVVTVLEIARQVCLAKGVNIADYRLVLYALMLILMMILRPEGLFGVNEVWDYFGSRRKRLKHLGGKPAGGAR